ncbi:MAG: hypothetical protein ACJ77A_10780 [Actinomycetota bacterium]
MRRAAPALALTLLGAVACTSPSPAPDLSPSAGSSTPSASAPTSGEPSPSFTLPPPSTGARSADAVRTRLCVRPSSPRPTPAQAGAVPPAVARTETEVEQVRGLRYEDPVAVDSVTHGELVRGLDQSFDHSYPQDLMRRRSLAWSTIGVIPDGTSLRDAVHAFLSGQVIGYFDPSSGQLVFIGTDHPSPSERFTLAHELTHADDDQHFHLTRLNDLEDSCDDEGLMASLGAVEGSAVYFSLQVVNRFFTAQEQDELSIGGGGFGPPPGVPTFVQQLETWPYVDGPRFITALRSEGGLRKVDAALEQFPASTEQVMHPEKFPADRPVEVSVPDLGPALGPGWKDLDVMDVGEEWLREALGLRIDRGDAGTATDGWGGAQYRAWTDGSHVAVLMETAWDTPEDARQFLGAMRSWIGNRADASVGAVGGDRSRVVALFASDSGTLARLASALR